MNSKTLFHYYRLKDKKAAIGFTYEDSTPGDGKGANKSDDDSDEDSDEDVETVDLGRWNEWLYL